MKRYMQFAVICSSLLILAGTAAAQKPRKLTEDAYLKTAKIEIISGDTVRYKYAMAMLDSLAMYYGPIPEALSLKSRVMVDFIDKTSDPKNKEPLVMKMAAYVDSLEAACASTTIKDKFKKNCKEFVALADSTRVKYWREFYNNGIAQLNSIDELKKQMGPDVTDSAIIISAKQGITANSDSALVNLRICTVLDPADSLAYLALGALYQKQKDFKTANEWLIKGLSYAKDSSQIIVSIAYNYIEADAYCDAIPYFRTYLAHQPKDTSTMYNLTICFNRCKMIDSCQVWYHKILDVAPQNYDALDGLGRFFNTLAIAANDSSRHYADLKDDAGAKKWSQLRTQHFDSSYTYFKAANAANPSDEGTAENYAVVAAILNRFEEASVEYEKLTKINPGSVNYWTSLGDCYLNMKQLDKATAAYEKVAELDPTNRPILERLSDLYGATGKPEKQAEIQKKLK